jgi:hypothetical protein
MTMKDDYELVYIEARGDGWQVILCVYPQFFPVGPRREDKGEAEWYAGQLRTAMDRYAAERVKEAKATVRDWHPKCGTCAHAAPWPKVPGRVRCTADKLPLPKVTDYCNHHTEQNRTGQS